MMHGLHSLPVSITMRPTSHKTVTDQSVDEASFTLDDGMTCLLTCLIDSNNNCLDSLDVITGTK